MMRPVECRRTGRLGHRIGGRCLVFARSVAMIMRRPLMWGGVGAGVGCVLCRLEMRNALMFVMVVMVVFGLVAFD